MNHTMPSDDYDIAVAKLAQLDALLLSITADGFDSYEGLNRKLRHDVLWLASDLAGEAHQRMVRHFSDQTEATAR
ncbi:hypothetical protein G9Q38_01445 [Pusillimonas sp. DMV24BSW_D]|jgi:hypothetical protein|uniref:hypothetical protein n=1 Tax=Neopusillimonas aestuarii TaxID=2716226 RepID=UPI00140983E4|nr:hypothetical protein [Pusillimonas sp. DMV24BSW_D]QIM47935.1 hypothetical protein G9Q38_01445 [Pusillimonas sp. DMV24BSW_D]